MPSKQPVRGGWIEILGGSAEAALFHSTGSLRFGTMRDRETIDSELRLIAAVRRTIREQGGEPSSHQVDELPDERLALNRRPI